MSTTKEITVKKIDNENIEINGVQITIDEYNKNRGNYSNRNIDTSFKEEYENLAKEIEGSIEDGHGDALPYLKSLVSKKKATGQGLGEKPAYQDIEKACQEAPQINKSDYDSEIEDIRTAIDEADINRKKEAAIKSNDKGNPDQKRKREEDNIPDNAKKSRLDANETKSVAELRNKTIEKIDNNSLATAIKVATQLEGEKEYQKDTEKVKLAEEELMKKDYGLYVKTVVEAIQKRIKDYGLNITIGEDGNVVSDILDAETKREYQYLLFVEGGAMTSEEELYENRASFQKSKDQVIKKIGELGAKSK
ncbi:5937_t:CDS:2 [Ambispora gerdemannii]|uniref:5937_t:CDS:1 n=1 Tax=Ambispora gerdemannii TaxID=144530 RepID=A0A9N8V2H9_9GLOM|nr:5937_t:CDS:2 [Ambispora gerdemannii]